ncbi:hypothetical protein [Chryseobacterium sp. YIM B08800]|uniref:hypothetical protein n=1 Tax=Chryseobacterium sp. YIM B08800 TaxID=2984136 RepID=UPI002240253F|nr:hypothetical protein [Chryseobacterium sp. YIM B08800]
MEHIKEQIGDFKKVLEEEIGIDLFNKLILHCKDNIYPNAMKQYANNLSIQEWVELYGKAKINVSENQVKVFFDYMIKYYEDFRKIQGKTYAVSRGFDRESESFEFEQIVFYSINL